MGIDYLTLAASRKYTDNSIANAQLGGEADLSGYATKTYVDDKTLTIETTKANKTEVENIGGRLSKVEEDYLTSDDKTEMMTAIDAAKQQAIDTILGDNIDADFDTLQEVAAWIQSDTTNSAQLITRVSTMENDITTKANKTEVENIGDRLSKVEEDYLTSDDKTEMMTAMDDKADENHTHNYAGASSAGGSAISSLSNDIVQIPSNADLDTYITRGFYGAPTTIVVSSLVNNPLPHSTGLYLEVYEMNSGIVLQIAYGTNGGGICKRRYNGTEWSAWTQMATTGDNVASATTISSKLPVSKGGTGATTLTSGQALIGNGTDEVTTRPINRLTSQNHLSYSGANNSDLATISTLAFWNGCYNATVSNLAYCNKGAFGNAAIKDVDTTLTPGSEKLITSGGVYSALHDYLPLSGGVMNEDALISMISSSPINGGFEVKSSDNAYSSKVLPAEIHTNTIWAPNLRSKSMGSPIMVWDNLQLKGNLLDSTGNDVIMDLQSQLNFTASVSALNSKIGKHELLFSLDYTERQINDIEIDYKSYSMLLLIIDDWIGPHILAECVTPTTRESYSSSSSTKYPYGIYLVGQETSGSTTPFSFGEINMINNKLSYSLTTPARSQTLTFRVYGFR